MKVVIRINMSNIFKTIGRGLLKIGPSIAGAVVTAPLAAGMPGAIVGIVGSILKSVVEAQGTGGSNDAKHQQVTGTFETIANIALPIAESLTGRDLDDERVKAGCGKIMEGLIDLLKGLGLFPTAAAPETVK